MRFRFRVWKSFDSHDPVPFLVRDPNLEPDPEARIKETFVQNLIFLMLEAALRFFYFFFTFVFHFMLDPDPNLVPGPEPDPDTRNALRFRFR